MRKDSRSEKREEIGTKAWIRLDGGFSVRACRLVDLSSSGVRILVDAPHDVAGRFSLLLTRGAPDIAGTIVPAGQTDILGSFTFRVSFQDAGQNFGIAGAISTLIFLLVGLLAYANFFALRRAAEARGRG